MQLARIWVLVVLSGLAFACQLWALTSTSDITRKESSLQQESSRGSLRRLQSLLAPPKKAEYDNDEEEDQDFGEPELDRCTDEEDDEECEERTAGPGHALTAGLKVHHLPGGLYTLRHARPNYPLAGLTYEERARARAAGKAADVEALMELKGQVVEDAEGLLNSWQEGQDPCTFERVLCDAHTGRVSEIEIASPDNIMDHYPELRNVMRDRGHTVDEPGSDADEDSGALQPTWLRSDQLDAHPSSIPWPDGYYQVEALRLRALPCGAFLNMAGTLRSLHVSNVRLQKAGLPNCWSAFSALREVTLFNVGLEGPLPPSWVGMRNLTALHLGDNPGLSGTLPSQWGALRRLRLLDLSLNFEAAARSGIQGTLPESWARMRSLTALDLWRTQVTGTLPAAWSAMQRLETLSVSDTLLAGTLPESWGELKHLKVLQLANTKVGGSLPAAWASAESLTFVDLRGTAMRPPVPRSWYSFCLRNGSKINGEWDQRNSGYGKAYILLPWGAPGGSLWELSNGERWDAPNNMCNQLKRRRRFWGVAVALALLAGVALLFRRNKGRVLEGLARVQQILPQHASQGTLNTLRVVFSLVSRTVHRSPQRQD